MNFDVSAIADGTDVIDIDANQTDSAGNTGNATQVEEDKDTTSPTITITAPTKTDNTAITDTTIQVTDPSGITAANVTVDGTTTATTSNFSCTQTSATQVDCTIQIDDDGDLTISATDDLSNGPATETESNYLISPDAVDDLATVVEDSTNNTIDWDDNDVLSDGATLDTFDTASTQGGSISDNGDGSFSYTPATEYYGNDTFTYTICDDDLPIPTCDTATITVDVQIDTDGDGDPDVTDPDDDDDGRPDTSDPSPLTPNASNDTMTVTEGLSSTYDILTNDDYLDNDDILNE